MEEASTPCQNRFRAVAGIQMVYDPTQSETGCGQKRKCPDCHFCQKCSQSRCQTCQGSKNMCQRTPGRKLSIREQIQLYDQINQSMER